jgi:hypothetical protein
MSIECCAESHNVVCRCTVKGKYELFDSNGQSTGKYVCGRHVDHTTICGSRAHMKKTYKICLIQEITVPLQTCCAQLKKVQKCTKKGEYELFDSFGQPTEKYVCSSHADNTTICGSYARIQGNVYKIPEILTELRIPEILTELRIPESESESESESDEKVRESCGIM